ncbi:MAG TPA: twin-arginine translocase subunit TatC [Actinomycetota bacterium]|nr:twin-arginine translocase subunit TatC [Actinomycetota bacterium]
MALNLRRRRRDPTATMTVVEHLEELRNRLIVSVAAVGLGMVGAWFLYQPVFNLLSDPYCDFMRAHPQLAFDPQDPCKLVFTSVVEPFLIKVKAVAFLGLVLALPVVLYQFWRFVTPGLTQRERRYAVPFVVASLVLFALGGWFALVTLPRGLSFLLGFAGTTRVASVVTIGKYLGFVMLLILAFGVAFEFPVVLVSLQLVGVLSTATLRRWRRYAWLLVAVLAAVITPSQDWFTMVALMLPLVVFYELSILIGRAFKR